MFFVLMSRRPPRSTRTDTPLPYPPAFLAYASPRLRVNPSLRASARKSRIGRRRRHSRQRDIFLAVAGNEREFAVLPVLLRRIDAVARRADEIPPQMARGRKGFPAEQHHARVARRTQRHRLAGFQYIEAVAHERLAVETRIDRKSTRLNSSH